MRRIFILNKKLLHTEIQDFITNNLTSDISKLLFKGSPFTDITIQEIVEQIEAKKKSKKKLPTWFNTSSIYYPNKLNIEQTSSEITAAYKAKLVKGNSLIDLTGGFGVDAYYFSQSFKKVVHCEHNNILSAIAKHNFNELGIQNIEVIPTDGINYLKKQQNNYDCIYLDPSRRNGIKGKVILLQDYEPNILKQLETLFRFSDIILMKASPMLDITSALNKLYFVKEIHVVAVENEVKELLFLIEKRFNNTITLKTVNVKKDYVERFDAIYPPQQNTDFSLPKKYLYEPNSAILKAGLFNEVSHQLKIYKLHINSHLCTSSKLIKFPGRCFKIEMQLPYNPKEIKKHTPSLKANITTRNFPETVAQIRKKTKLKDGGENFLFFTTDINDKHIVLLCKKL